MTEAHVVCDSTSMTVFLDKGLLSNGTDADDVNFVDEDCVGIDHDSKQIVLYTRNDMCSTTVEVSTISRNSSCCIKEFWQRKIEDML